MKGMEYLSSSIFPGASTTWHRTIETLEFRIKQNIEMTPISIPLLIFLGIIIFSSSPSAYAVEWSICADDLDSLRRGARDASDAAQNLASKSDELQNCLKYPDTYDLTGDKCQSLQWDYDSALSNLESELSTVNRRLHSVQASCGFQFYLGSSLGSKTNQTPELCQLYRSYKGKLPIAQLLETCKQSAPESECKKCLDIK